MQVDCEFDEIVARFRKNTRYELKRAGRIGITVRRAESELDFLRFYEIYQQRASLRGFDHLTSSEFAELSERIRSAPERSAIFLSEHRGDILAGAVLVRAGPRVYYLYGATATNAAGNLPAAYPVLSHAIEWTKAIGCTELDFGGAGPAGAVRHFKEGFGGNRQTFVATYSLTLKRAVPLLRRLAARFRG